MEQWNKRIDKIFTKDDIHHHFYHHVNYCVFSLDQDGVIYDVNEQFLRHFGYEMDEVVGKRWQDFVHPDDLELSQQVSDKNIPRETFAQGWGHFDNRYRKKNGEYQVLRWTEGDATFFDDFYICYAKIWMG